jgi:multidrug efflux pump
VAIPLSLIGAFFIMMILGYTINLLTLLAMVLSIGLVVDDAIIVVENIHRHIEEGVPPLEASINGARELAGPIIIITIVLIAVYLPIGFMGGLTGALFTEFVYTLAATVVVSAVVALTLSPMMCSRMLKTSDSDKRRRLTAFTDRQFNRLRSVYGKVLHGTLNSLPVVGVFAVIIFVSIYFLFVNSKSELAPQEDQGFIIAMFTAAPDATLQQTQLYSEQVAEILSPVPEIEHLFRVEGISGVNAGIAGLVLKPWDERERTTHAIHPEVQNKLGVIAGAHTVASQPSSLPKSGHGLPVEFVIGTTDSYERLNEVSDSLMAKAQESGLFMYVDKDLKIDKPKVEVAFDRNKAALLGLSMSDLGKSLGSMLSGGYVNYFNLSGRSYKVIPQVKQSSRLTADQLKDYYITTPDGNSIPLSTVAQLKTTVAPESLSHFQQLNSATISAILLPGITLGEALEKLNELAEDILPQGYSVDYSGESRQYFQESTSLMVTFISAMVIIFLALAAQFESFRDPFIILICVPMAICGALIFLYLGVGGATLNIYTEVGLITLIGLISKNGILIVEFANELQRAGKKKREAIEQAAATRLRPILMTSASTILGALPLVLASGAGAAGRYNIGLIITTGMAIGTLFTLFVVPAMYLVLAHNFHQEKFESINEKC